MPPKRRSPATAAEAAGQAEGDDIVVELAPTEAWAQRIDELAALLALVFADNRLYQGLFQLEGNAQDAALRWLFGKRLELLAIAGGPLAWARDRVTDQIVGMVGALPPDRKPSIPTMIRAGMGSWACRYGLASFGRALYIDAVLVAPGPGEWELAMMAVDPRIQGRGIGTRILQTLCATILERTASGAAHVRLTTQKEINVAFYGRQGFHLKRKDNVQNAFFRLPAFDSWEMAQIITKDSPVIRPAAGAK